MNATIHRVEACFASMTDLPDTRLFPFIAQISPPSRRRLEQACVRHRCHGGQPLVARGDEVAGAYLVERGALRIYYASAEGREGTLYWTEPGESCILALNCTFSRLAYPAWVESDGETEFTVIPGGVYRELFASETAVQQFTFSALSGRLFELMRLVEETASSGLEARMAAFLLRRSKDRDHVDLTQDQLARHLSTSREVVSRLMRGLAAQGLVQSAQGRVSLLDREGLQAVAG